MLPVVRSVLIAAALGEELSASPKITPAAPVMKACSFPLDYKVKRPFCLAPPTAKYQNTGILEKTRTHITPLEDRV